MQWPSATASWNADEVTDDMNVQVETIRPPSPLAPSRLRPASLHSGGSGIGGGGGGGDDNSDSAAGTQQRAGAVEAPAVPSPQVCYFVRAWSTEGNGALASAATAGFLNPTVPALRKRHQSLSS
jgi:hypothetical protein